MGSSSGSINEQPIASVTLSRSFYFSATEISQRIYRIVTGSNPSTIIADELAVNNIGWLDAIKFCNKLSKLQNLDSVYQISGDNVIWNTKANGWRLPTEAEWEYSCRAGTTTDYNSNSLVDVAWYSDNSGNKMHPVGKKLANDFGLFDMHGNLWEWCYDYYDDFYYDTRPAIDPTGPKAGTRRVIRGGAFDKGPNYARSANRTIPENLNGNTGLRIARTKFN